MPPPPDEAGEQFRLRFDVGTLDERITMRAELAALRGDPSVLSVTPTADAHLGFYEVTLHADCESTPLVRRLRDRYGPHLSANPFFDISYVYEPTDPNAVVNIPQETRERIIQQALANPDGRRRLFQTLAPPLRSRIDYHAIGRRTFLVDQLPEGALPTYDRDPHPDPEVEVPAPPPEGLPELPSWCVVGTWVRHGSIIGCIFEVATLTVTLAVWREYRSDGSPRLLIRHRRDVASFHLLPGEPAPPRTVYQRLLDDDWELG